MVRIFTLSSNSLVLVQPVVYDDSNPSQLQKGFSLEFNNIEEAKAALEEANGIQLLTGVLGRPRPVSKSGYDFTFLEFEKL